MVGRQRGTGPSPQIQLSLDLLGKVCETDSDGSRWLCEQWDLERCDATGHCGEKNICIRPLSKLQMTWDFVEYIGGMTEVAEMAGRVAIEKCHGWEDSATEVCQSVLSGFSSSRLIV